MQTATVWRSRYMNGEMVLRFEGHPALHSYEMTDAAGGFVPVRTGDAVGWDADRVYYGTLSAARIPNPCATK